MGVLPVLADTDLVYKSVKPRFTALTALHFGTWLTARDGWDSLINPVYADYAVDVGTPAQLDKHLGYASFVPGDIERRTLSPARTSAGAAVKGIRGSLDAWEDVVSKGAQLTPPKNQKPPTKGPGTGSGPGQKPVERT